MNTLPPVEARVAFVDAPDTEWKVTGLSLEEALNEPYCAQVELETADLDADTRALLGSTCELTLGRRGARPRLVFGVVTRVDHLGQDDHHLLVAVTVVPSFALARQRQSSRIWQQESVHDIVRQTLAASLDVYGRSIELGHLRRGARPRDYCTQYRETDLAFVSRLLEEEGITYLFVHDEDAGHEVLTLLGDNDDYPEFANLDGSSSLPIIAHSPDEADIESMQRFCWTEQLRPTSAALSEYDFGRPGTVSADEAGTPDARGRVRRQYDHSRRRPGSIELGQHAHALAAAASLDASVAECEGNASSLAPGQRFILVGGAESTPEEWLVVAVQHEYSPGEEGVASYRNKVRCVPATAELRPEERTPKPSVQGPQTATVVGDGEIDVDELGRIQVQFHWPEDPSFAAGSSCRVRCSQSWAGGAWGAQFIPRVGMEVVVEFIEGNPDRPLVTGCVYNGANAPPFGLPGSSTQSGWRTSSSPGGGGSNELRFDDAAGGEEIYLHGQRDWTTVVKRNKAQTIGNDEVLRVANDRLRTVEANERVAIGSSQELRVGADQAESVGANQSLSVGSSRVVSVALDQSMSVGSNRSETVGAYASEAVAVSKNVCVNGMLATVVGGAMNTAVGAALLEEVGGIKTVSVGVSSDESVVGHKSVDAGSISHSAGKDLSQSAGANMSLSVGEELSVAATGQVSIAGKHKGVIEFEDELTLKVGKASITLKKNGQVVVEGATIDVKGKKSINLEARKVNQN
ncbi:type VI secretion system tip protein VgrG [Pseudenhygromyxa sp. WMMC2535]|uniref:type VI secretion system Vgr family protein n=1 Tax=Pseudenhygromyxa sp. WMMC2535 TaxID=2712867 RepID=UPI00155740D8|nr:type VI secretion system tip protein TssI/VgrG [Pseudenhygromyxa sp. WMMC2535]NVB38748.1 type VI secretion system tip protein VgrG [Pseudenhygromyxa sp. WMMC2535]